MPSEIPFIRPNFPTPEDLADDYRSILSSNWFTNFGPMERRLSAALAGYVNGDVTATTAANGTLALIAAVQAAMGRGTGDTCVVMPSFTFVAAAQALVWTGHRPLFVDVDPLTWQPDLDSARRALSGSDLPVAGILLANVFGVGNSEIAAWEELAAQHDVPLVIDSAAGFGSWYTDDERVGGRGTCEIFSLHATKPFAVGEGGAVLSKDDELIAAVDRFANFGFDAHRASVSLGLNAKLSELAAAIGLRQLPELDRRLEQRRKVFEIYRDQLAADFEFQPNAERSSLCFASLRCRSVGHKDAVRLELAAQRVDGRDYYNPPLHRQPYFLEAPASFAAVDLQTTDDLCERIISVPIHDDMAEGDIERIVHALTAAGRAS